MKSMASRRRGMAGSTMVTVDGRYGGEQREICGEQREISGAQREISGAQRDGCEGGCGVGELQLWYTPY